MITDFDKILNDLSYKVKDGIPNLKNEQHLIKLWEQVKSFPKIECTELFAELFSTKSWAQLFLGIHNFNLEGKVLLRSFFFFYFIIGHT